MNNSSIEGAFKTWLGGAGLGVTILTGESFDEIPTDARAVIAEVAEMQNPVGPLHRAVVKFTTTSPFPFVTLAEHRSTAGAVRALVDGYAASPGALNAAITAAGATMRGLCVKSSDGDTHEGRWFEVLEFVVGLQAA